MKEDSIITKSEVNDDGEGKILEDFILKEYRDPYSTEAQLDQIIPIGYQDNEDGYWDSYNKAKMAKFNDYAMSEMIIGRPFFRH